VLFESIAGMEHGSSSFEATRGPTAPNDPLGAPVPFPMPDGRVAVHRNDGHWRCDVERGSDKHGPRLDDELEHETRGMRQGAPVSPRIEDFRKTEEVEVEEEEEAPPQR
jgi:hypothetical protein